MSKKLTQAQLNKLIGRKGVRLNIGCGTDYKPGWINIDNNSDHNITKLDLNWDLRDPLPFKNGSVDYVFNEHFIEHLTPDEASLIINDLMRVLKPGGVLRIAMPDLESIIRQYRKGLKNDPLIKNFKMDFIKTRAESINMSFRWWGHMWLYDWEELVRRLNEFNESKYPELRNLETRRESNLIAEVTK
jgi:predicted SAM-dependent methyltransferase